MYNWLVPLVRPQLDDSPESQVIIRNLGSLGKPERICSCGCGSPYFVDPESPNYNLKKSIAVHISGDRKIVVDVLQDNRIGGIDIFDARLGSA